MARNSYSEQEAITWQPAKLRLGSVGLDLRESAETGALKKLMNARFLDETTLERRNGYAGVQLRDAADYPQLIGPAAENVDTPLTPTGWVYGHGQLLAQNALTSESSHYPIPGVARGTFNFEGTNVAWTGDRLLVVRNDGHPALGHSVFWGADPDRGIPAYLPVQTETAPPEMVTGSIETCLTATSRVVVTTSSTGITAWVLNRDTGAVIAETQLDDAALAPRLLRSGSYVIAMWINGPDLHWSQWSGVAWSAAAVLRADVDYYDVAATDDGLHLLWRDGGTLMAGKFAGKTTQAVPYTFGTTITTTGNAPNGAVALAVAPSGVMAVVYEASDGLKMIVLDSALTAGTQGTLSADATWDYGITVSARALSSSSNGTHPFVVHAGRSASKVTRVYEIHDNDPSVIVHQDARFNSRVYSKSFRVGNEVFCWLRANNSGTHYLVAGSHDLQVVGVADREVADVAAGGVGLLPTLASVNRDPRSEYALTWARPFITGQTYDRPGNARIGDLNFLPRFSAAQYGDSVYIIGSHVRNWDGVELGDAGFHDYPTITAAPVESTHGASFLTAEGTYRIRVYAVRYNKRGERFQSAAVTSAGATLTGLNNRLVWTANTLPLTNHDDVVLEYYRTEAGGTTYYLENTLANDRTAATVSFSSILSDAELITRQADPHETGVAGDDELEEFGPIGCGILVSAGDRLWGAGGQVPRGRVQFSKLKEEGEGAGFDSLASTQLVDTEGGEITSMAPLSDSMLLFERERVYAMFGAGPNNYGYGAFSTPQVVLADGATTHAGTIATQHGILYWGVDGPRLMTHSLRVEPICLPVRALTAQMDPSGVQVDLARQEVVWFTESGTAVLWNYAGPRPRWAQWTGLKIAGCSPFALVTTDGRLLTELADAGDDGRPFAFGGETGDLNPEGVLAASAELNRVGIVGTYHGPHRLRMRVYFNGAAMWTDQMVWNPTDDTWLTTVEDLGALTAAQIDALDPTNQAGTYSVHKKTSRHECRSFRVEWSDIYADCATYTPLELTLELGVRGGLGRQAPATFTRS